MIRRRAVVFLISDFHDVGYDPLLKRVGRQHDLIVVRITDPFEHHLPRVGLMTFEDAETGQQILLDTSNQTTCNLYAESARHRREQFARLMRAAQADVLEVGTDGRHFDGLVDFFRRRNRRLMKR